MERAREYHGIYGLNSWEKVAVQCNLRKKKGTITQSLKRSTVLSQRWLLDKF